MDAVFLWIPKTAGASICKALDIHRCQRLGAINETMRFKKVTFGHLSLRHLVRGGYIPNELPGNAFVFTFVRNPYSRSVSLYSYLRKKRDYLRRLSFVDFLRFIKDHPTQKIGLANVRGLSQCNPQVAWTKGIQLDFTGKYEDLETSVNQLRSRFGSVAELPYLNRSKHSQFERYYVRREAAELVRTLYRDDFEAFGYSMRPPK